MVTPKTVKRLKRLQPPRCLSSSLKEMTELAAVYECVNAAAELYEVPKPIARAYEAGPACTSEQQKPVGSPAI